MIRILYVDDEELLLDVCKSFLEGSGDISVDIATSAKEALDLLSKDSYEAVVSDYQMPEMNGIDLLKEIRSKSEIIPFILFTGKGREEIAIEALNNGADFYMQKGGDPTAQFAELEHKIKEAVRRNRAENALKLNEARLKNAQAIGMIGSWEYGWDDHSAYFWGSEESFRIFGVRRPADGKVPQTVIGSCIVEKDATVRTLQALKDGVSGYDIEYHINPADGSPVRIVRSKADLVTDAEGHRTKIVGVIQDITERKRAEEGLHRLNKELKAIKECNKALFHAKTEEELVNDICRIVCETAGYRMAWIGMALNDKRRTVKPVAWNGHVGEYFKDLDVTWGDDDTGKGAVGTAIRNRSTVMLSDICNNPNMRPWRESLLDLGFHSLITIPLVDAGNAFGAFSIYITDDDGFTKEEVDLLEEMAGDLAYGIISIRSKESQIRAEEALRKSQELYSKLMVAIPDIVIVTNMEGIIQMVNEVALLRSGYRKEDVIGKPFLTFIAPEDHEKSIRNTFRMLEGALGPVEYRLVFKDGSKVLFEANGDVYRNHDGSPDGLVFVGRDLTEHRRMETRLREANRKLRVLDSITRHDTLNKLIVIKGYLEMARRMNKDDKMQVSVNKVERNVDSLIEQLNLTREYQTIGTETPEWQSVGAACRKGMEQLDLQNVELKIDVGNMEVLADPLLNKVFYNLIDNSLKHGEDVTKIEIGVAEENGHAKIIYRDNGVGIYPENKEQLFMEGHGRNHGMGLFLSREILGITGITIQEVGQPRQGVIFEMIVPKGSFRNGSASAT